MNPQMHITYTTGIIIFIPVACTNVCQGYDADRKELTS